MSNLLTHTIADVTKTNTARVSPAGELSISDPNETLSLLRELLLVNKGIANQLAVLTGKGPIYNIGNGEREGVTR